MDPTCQFLSLSSISFPISLSYLSASGGSICLRLYHQPPKLTASIASHHVGGFLEPPPRHPPLSSSLQPSTRRSRPGRSPRCHPHGQRLPRRLAAVAVIHRPPLCTAVRCPPSRAAVVDGSAPLCALAPAHERDTERERLCDRERLGGERRRRARLGGDWEREARRLRKTKRRRDIRRRRREVATLSPRQPPRRRCRASLTAASPHLLRRRARFT